MPTNSAWCRQRAAVDHRTDIYSLGATLYELLTLHSVFSVPDRAELLRRIAVEPPRPPRKLNRSLPAELETIVLKALEKNPADRYRTAGELADDLQRFLDHRPIRARRSRVVAHAKATWWTLTVAGAEPGCGNTRSVLLRCLPGEAIWRQTTHLGLPAWSKSHRHAQLPRSTARDYNARCRCIAFQAERQ